MAYEVLWTPDAKRDLDVAVSYLAESMGMASAAAKLLDGIEKLITTLRAFPEAHEYARDDYLAARGFRKTLAGSYIVLYLVDAQYEEVVITNIVHAARDYARFV